MSQNEKALKPSCDKKRKVVKTAGTHVVGVTTNRATVLRAATDVRVTAADRGVAIARVTAADKPVSGCRAATCSVVRKTVAGIPRTTCLVKKRAASVTVAMNRAAALREVRGRAFVASRYSAAAAAGPATAPVCTVAHVRETVAAEEASRSSRKITKSLKRRHEEVEADCLLEDVELVSREKKRRRFLEDDIEEIIEVVDGDRGYNVDNEEDEEAGPCEQVRYSPRLNIEESRICNTSQKSVTIPPIDL